MITNFKIFEKRYQIDEKTIRAELKERGSYIDFFFDDKDRLIGVDNKWDVYIPDWFGFPIPLNAIVNFFRSVDKRYEVYTLLQHNMNIYNL